MKAQSNHPKWCHCALCDPSTVPYKKTPKPKSDLPYRNGKEKLRQMRRRAEISTEAFLGKSALLQTYEQMGLEPPADLKKRVDDKRCQLRYRGAL